MHTECSRVLEPHLCLLVALGTLGTLRTDVEQYACEAWLRAACCDVYERANKQSMVETLQTMQDSQGALGKLPMLLSTLIMTYGTRSPMVGADPASRCEQRIRDDTGTLDWGADQTREPRDDAPDWEGLGTG